MFAISMIIRTEGNVSKVTIPGSVLSSPTLGVIQNWPQKTFFLS